MTRCDRCVRHWGSAREGPWQRSLVSCLNRPFPTTMAGTPGQPLRATSGPPAHGVTCGDALQNKAIQAERRSAVRDAGTCPGDQEHPPAPTQLLWGSSSSCAQGHRRFSWVPLPSAVPRGTRSQATPSPPSPSSLTSQGLLYQIPAPKIIYLQKGIYTAGALETAPGTSRGYVPTNPVCHPSWARRSRAPVPAGAAQEERKARAERVLSHSHPSGRVLSQGTFRLTARRQLNALPRAEPRPRAAFGRAVWDTPGSARAKPAALGCV